MDLLNLQIDFLSVNDPESSRNHVLDNHLVSSYGDLPNIDFLKLFIISSLIRRVRAATQRRGALAGDF
jgi:hypothetical protein